MFFADNGRFPLDFFRAFFFLASPLLWRLDMILAYLVCMFFTKNNENNVPAADDPPPAPQSQAAQPNLRSNVLSPAQASVSQENLTTPDGAHDMTVVSIVILSFQLPIFEIFLPCTELSVHLLSIFSRHRFGMVDHA